MSLIPSELIDEIRQRVNLVDLVSEHVRLKKVGRNHVGLCPFHQEKTPSFSVSEEKQLYHCFGCGQGGSALTFVMNTQHLSFKDALDVLAQRAGVDLSRFLSQTAFFEKEKKIKEAIHKILKYAQEKYTQALMHPSMGERARLYLKNRKIDLDLAKQMKLGFAPPSWDQLSLVLQKDGFSLDDAHEAGLVQMKKNKQPYDVFRNRLMFPIFDQSDRVIAFGARTLENEEPKYLNSKETPVFIKRKTLYGFSQASAHIKSKDFSLVVEGYMDQIMLCQNGFFNTVATLGTALSVDHAMLLKRVSSNVCLVFDGDQAGQKAMIRSLEPLLMVGLNVKLVILPESLDPDEFLQKYGSIQFQKLVDQSPSALEFYIQEHYLKQSSLAKKSQAIETMRTWVANARGVAISEALLSEILRVSGMSRNAFEEKNEPLKNVHPLRTKTVLKPLLYKVDHLEQWVLVRIAAQVPQARSQLDECFESGYIDVIEREQWTNWKSHVLEGGVNRVELSSLFHQWENEDNRSTLLKAMMLDYDDLTTTWKKVWDDCLKKIQKNKIKELSQALAIAEDKGDDREVMALSHKMLELKNNLQKIKTI